ncbi:hypothetical protein DPM19_25940 [Actinomadura craniellae]|uniref:SAF domain-containing protein n=1 Tax=Actinomadura craniellae TaxID=2231787 RepID=A0A365GZH0_9ACTN|nr:hypothetical protein [Actinomadura craniellae]RAY12168.1 hypothetical protein DPM19_25940 [Actinomadura craniellae]
MKSSQTTAPGNPAALGRTGLGSGAGQRLPVPPRERKPALAALAVLLIIGGALASAYLVMASGQRVSAVRIAQPVAAGQQIPASALEEVQIGDTGIAYIRWSERHKVTQAYAAVPLVRGALLTNGMVSGTNDAIRGRLIVGLALKPGQMPANGLRPGLRVSLYAVGTAASGGPRPGAVLAEEAIVYDVGGDGREGTVRGEQVTVSVAVPPAQAPLVTQAASAGAIAVAVIPTGTTVPPAGQQPPAQQPPVQQAPRQPVSPSPGLSSPPVGG